MKTFYSKNSAIHTNLKCTGWRHHRSGGSDTDHSTVVGNLGSLLTQQNMFHYGLAPFNIHCPFPPHPLLSYTCRMGQGVYWTPNGSPQIHGRCLIITRGDVQAQSETCLLVSVYMWALKAFKKKKKFFTLFIKFWTHTHTDKTKQYK